MMLRNLQESIGIEKIEECFGKNKILSMYWGTAPTGRPHIAYFLPMTKLADFLKVGCEVTVLFANLHAYLDNMKAPWELLQKRTDYYEILIKGMLKALNVPLDKLNFVRGTDYQLRENYTANVYKIIAMTTAHDAAKAGCDVVKQVSDPLISGIVYPLLQALDEEFLGVDAQFGGVDQRKIFTYAEKYLPNLGFAKRSHLMNPMIPGLTGGKMSASEENSKIDLLDDMESIHSKLKSANCSGSTSETNGLLAFIKFVILPIKSHLNIEKLNQYDSIDDVEKDFQSGQIDETVLKEIVENSLEKLMKNLRHEFELANQANLDKEAYPTEPIQQIDLNEVIDHIDHCSKKLEEFPQQLESFFEIFPSVKNSWQSIQSIRVFGDIPSIMWTVRASGEPHLGYMIPISKLAQLSSSGWRIKIVIEDIGAHLHSHHQLNRPTWNAMKHRAELYRRFICAAFDNCGGNTENMEIILGSDFQLSSKYALLLYQSFSHITERECKEMVLQMFGISETEAVSNLSSIIYPCVTVLDQLHLRPTIRLVGNDFPSEKFESFSQTLSTRLHGNRHCVPRFVQHEMILSLDGSSQMKSPKIGPKTAPKDNTSIALCDNLETILRKMKKAFFDPKNLEKDPSLNILESIIWPMLQTNETFVVQRTAENGGDVHFKSIGDIRHQLLNDLMHPGDVKSAVVEYLNRLIINPINQSMSAHSATIDFLMSCAFPVEQKKKKINAKSFNPNKIDIRVAVVKSIIFKQSEFHIELESGLEIFSLTRSHIYSWTPNDICLIAVLPSNNDQKSKLIGVLCQKVDKDKPVPLKLIKKCYVPRVSFNNYEFILPHMKENESKLIVEQIEKNCTINGLNQLEWLKDVSVAYDIELIGGQTKNIVVQ